MTIFYIGLPAIIGLVFLVAVLLAYSAIGPKDPQIRVSVWIALAQAALALLAVGLTMNNPISEAACTTGSRGSALSAGIAALDTINLLWWVIRRARAERTLWLPLPYLFVLLRLLTHAIFTLSLWWCGQLCTV